MDHIGEKIQTTSPLEVHNRVIPKQIMHTPKEGLHQSYSKNLDSNLGFLPFLFHFR